MVFQIGKIKSANERPLQDETIDRWRQAAARTNSEPLNSDFEGPITSLDTAWEIGQEEKRLIPQSPAQLNFAQRDAAPHTLDPTIERIERKIERVAVDSPRPSTLFNNESPYRSRAIPSDPNLPVDEDLARRFGSRVKSALGPGATIQGKLTFESPVRIDGSLMGEVTSTSTLIVGDQGNVKAEVKVGSLVVLGQVTGNVVAQDLVEIKKGGRLEADVQAGRLVIEDGGYFQGKCTMRKQ